MVAHFKAMSSWGFGECCLGYQTDRGLTDHSWAKLCSTSHDPARSGCPDVGKESRSSNWSDLFGFLCQCLQVQLCIAVHWHVTSHYARSCFMSVLPMCLFLDKVSAEVWVP